MPGFHPCIVLGIDPGLATTGYGVLKSEGEKIKTLDYGIISTKSVDSIPKRLKILSEELNRIIKKYKPDVVAHEKIFFCKNTKTAIVIGEAIGAILLTCANFSIDIVEYTPIQIKQAIVGYGRAEKIQMQKMLQVLLGLKEMPEPDDAADALAAGVAYIYSLKLENCLNSI